jgi:hypothetical protein
MQLAEKIILKSPFNIDEINGIKFKDIMHIINSKEEFENILFSTRILFESKEELLEFFEMLLKYGYKDSALNYLEELILNLNDYDIIERFNSLLR